MIPSIFEKDRSYDIYSKLLEDRIIFLAEEIDKEVAASIIAQMISLNIKNSEEEISFYIMSPGGDMAASFAIFDTMNFISAPVATYCIGEAFSGASLLLAAGKKGRRFSLPSSRIMIHQLRGGLSGTYEEMAVQHEESTKLEASLVAKLAKLTGKSPSVIEKAISKDLYLSPKEAVTYGLIDKVIEREPS